MNNRILGPGGVPVIGSAGQPVSPCMDIKQTEDGPTFRLPVVSIGFIPPEIIAAIAAQVAGHVVAEVLKVAAGGAAKAEE
jgi:hypothetical protein